MFVNQTLCTPPFHPQQLINSPSVSFYSSLLTDISELPLLTPHLLIKSFLSFYFALLGPYLLINSSLSLYSYKQTNLSALPPPTSIYLSTPASLSFYSCLLTNLSLLPFLTAHLLTNLTSLGFYLCLLTDLSVLNSHPPTTLTNRSVFPLHPHLFVNSNFS
jgi:hypothetical protein